MRSLAADLLAQLEHQRLGHDQAAGEVEVLAHARREHLKPAEQDDQALEHIAGELAALGEGAVFRMVGRVHLHQRIDEMRSAGDLARPFLAGLVGDDRSKRVRRYRFPGARDWTHTYRTRASS